MQYDLDGLYKNSVAYSLKRLYCENVTILSSIANVTTVYCY